MRPELPATYYLDNVHTLFAQVQRLYADILDDDLLEFIESFARLGQDAQKLLIRLLNRSGDRFRLQKLNYPEIGAIDAAITELERHHLIAVDAAIDTAELLALFTKTELLQLARADSALARLRRIELEAVLLEAGDSRFWQRLQEADTLLEVLCGDHYQLCQMLFFGNLNQSMTDFVLRDLGLHQYEAYQIDHQHRPYRNGLEIQQHWLLYQLEILFQLGDSGDAGLLQSIVASIPPDIDPLAPAYRKSERLRYEIARQLERLGEYESALEQFERCPLPQSRERRARIFDRLGDHASAFRLCLEINETPLDEAEVQFASRFATRLAQRHQLSLPDSVRARQVRHKPEIIELELDYRDSVEIAVAEFFNQSDAGGSCHYLENSLFNGVLGLLLWDIVFAPLPGAFYNRFQYRPSDFYAFDFCRRRRHLLQRRWDSIRGNDDIRDIVAQRWRQKNGLMNPLVNWQDLDLELIELALERIEHRHWRAIFDRILEDLRNNRAGFPDLVYFPATGGYRLIEVKGPGDALQKNQRRWMQFFQQQGIPHQLARVAWRSD